MNYPKKPQNSFRPPFCFMLGTVPDYYYKKRILTNQQGVWASPRTTWPWSGTGQFLSFPLYPRRTCLTNQHHWSLATPTEGGRISSALKFCGKYCAHMNVTWCTCEISKATFLVNKIQGKHSNRWQRLMVFKNKTVKIISLFS